MAGATKVGVIGCGNISGIYLTNCRRLPGLELVACADLDRARAQAKAAEHGIRAASVDELLADPDIDLVINLTIPAVHAEVSMSALAAGKHVYTEKPLATRRKTQSMPPQRHDAGQEEERGERCAQPRRLDHADGADDVDRQRRADLHRDGEENHEEGRRSRGAAALLVTSRVMTRVHVASLCQPRGGLRLREAIDCGSQDQ